MNFPHKNMAAAAMDNIEADLTDKTGASYRDVCGGMDHDMLVEAIKERQQTGHSAKLYAGLNSHNAGKFDPNINVTGENILQERIGYFAKNGAKEQGAYKKIGNKGGLFRPDIAKVFQLSSNLVRGKTIYDQPVNLDD